MTGLGLKTTLSTISRSPAGPTSPTGTAFPPPPPPPPRFLDDRSGIGEAARRAGAVRCDHLHAEPLADVRFRDRVGRTRRSVGRAGGDLRVAGLPVDRVADRLGSLPGAACRRQLLGDDGIAGHGRRGRLHRRLCVGGDLAGRVRARGCLAVRVRGRHVETDRVVRVGRDDRVGGAGRIGLLLAVETVVVAAKPLVGVRERRGPVPRALVPGQDRADLDRVNVGDARLERIRRRRLAPAGRARRREQGHERCEADQRRRDPGYAVHPSVSFVSVSTAKVPPIVRLSVIVKMEADDRALAALAFRTKVELTGGDVHASEQRGGA